MILNNVLQCLSIQAHYMEYYVLDGARNVFDEHFGFSGIFLQFQIMNLNCWTLRYWVIFHSSPFD